MRKVLLAALPLTLAACGQTAPATGSVPPAVTALGAQPTSSAMTGPVNNVQLSGTAVYDMSGSLCSGPLYRTTSS